MKAGIVSRTDAPEALSVARRIHDYLTSNGVEVFIETETALALDMANLNRDLLDFDGDFVVTVGGDGTILRTAMGMKNPDTPLLGVNMGRRGFLSEVPPEGIEEALGRILREEYEIEEHLKLSSRALELSDIFPDALNEVLVASSLPSKTLLVGLYVNDEHITDIQADGVIVSTPAGSTAYNLSAGGSIMAPDVKAMMLTTICPYSYFRSLAVPTDAKIKVQLLKPKADALAIIDGRVYTALKPLSTVEVWASPYKVRFIRFKPFYRRLKNRINQFKIQ